MKKHFQLLVVFVLAAVMMVGLNLLYGPQTTTQAAAVPTPLAPAYSSDNPGAIIRFWADGTVITQDTASTAFQLGSAEALDIQYVLVHQPSGEVNTTTFKLQFSNDNQNWTDGVNVIGSSAADATNLLQFHNFGAWTRVYADTTLVGTKTVTITNFSALPRR